MDNKYIMRTFTGVDADGNSITFELEVSADSIARSLGYVPASEAVVGKLQDAMNAIPFGEETVTYLEWDGDVTGLEFNSELGGYKLSDTPLTVEELMGSTVVIKSIADGSEQNLVVTEDVLTVQGNLITAQIIASLLEDTELMGVMLTKGIWHFSPDTVGNYVSRITKSTVKKIDVKFMPNELYTEIDTRIDNYINEALGGEY